MKGFWAKVDKAIPYVIFRFHEEISICRFHELRHPYVKPKTKILHFGKIVFCDFRVLIEAVKNLVSMGKIFPDRNQICRNLLSDFITFMLSNFFSDNSISRLSVPIHIYQIFCTPIRH